MRAGWIGCLAACLVAHLGVTTVCAQDEFDDDFGDFGEEEAPAPRPAPAERPTPPAAPSPAAPTPAAPSPAAPPSRTAAPGPEATPAGSAGPADAGEDDPFEDDFDAEPATAPDAPEPAPVAAGAPEDSAPASTTSPPSAGGRDGYRARRYVLHNSWYGTVGGVRIVDAGSGADATFRAQLGLNFFFVEGWLQPGDSNSHIGGNLSISWTPFEFLELFTTLKSWANSNDQEDPILFQVLGDTLFGIKAFGRATSWLTLGGDVSVGFLNTVGDIGLVLDSTSVGLRLNAAADLRELEDRIPMVARLNLQYWFDNSQALIASVEDARYAALPTSGPDQRQPRPLEDRHLITRIERYALQIDRHDRFTIGVGFEFPIPIMEGFTLSPIAEWMLNIPVNRQGFTCLRLPAAGTDRPAPGEDGCVDWQGFDAYEQTVTLGVRVLPPLRGLSILAAADIGVTGTYTFVRELSGQAPYNVMLAFAYAYDTVPEVRTQVREVERQIEVRSELPPDGRVIGSVVEQGSEVPVAGAVVSFEGRDLTSLSASDQGGFVSHPLPPGEVAMVVRHPEYREGTCSGVIAEEGGDVEVRCELEALPRIATVRGRVVSSQGGVPVGGAQVSISGPASRELTSGPDGNFVLNDMAPGNYTVRVDAENYLLKQESFEVEPMADMNVNVELVPRPRRPLVRVRRRAIVIRRRVNFATNSATIEPSSSPLMYEVADVIMRHPEIRKIRIEGHTDNRGGSRHNQELSQRRAEAVRSWLLDAGVEASRLDAQGFGQNRPLVPNITSTNRARNRRVQFTILERAQE